MVHFHEDKHALIHELNSKKKLQMKHRYPKMSICHNAHPSNVYGPTNLLWLLMVWTYKLNGIHMHAQAKQKNTT